MELMQWFFMGVLFTVSVFGLSYLSLVVRLKWYTWACLITGRAARSWKELPSPAPWD